MTVRAQLDYIVWVTEAMEPIGFHPAPELEAWRRRVQTAYSSLIDSFTPGHGDPLPPDVPPTVRPGQWPDVPAYSVPGMHVRHQLTVLRTVSGISRTNLVFPHTPADVATWTARVQTAYDALDHGPARPMPDSAKTQAPPPPVNVRHGKKKPIGSHVSVGGKKTAHAPKATAKKAPAKKRGKAKK
jgi:hypothetical protein